MSRRDPVVYVRHMLDHAKEAVEITHERTRTDLDENRMLNLAVVRLVEIVGESCNRIPKEFRNENPDIPWREVSGVCVSS